MAQEGTENIKFAGTRMLGCDCAEGKGVDASANVVRGMNVAECIFESNQIDEMQHAGQIILDMDMYKIDPLNTAIDDSGGGTIARIREQRRAVQGINTAEQAFDPKRFYNKRAEGYWLVRQWIKNGGKLIPHPRWHEFIYVKYKVHSSGRILIIPKDEIRKKSNRSPDLCDALMHTFLIPAHNSSASAEELFFVRKMRQNKLKDAVRRSK